MKIALQTWGSEGDIRPFLALAGGLSANGHDVALALTSVDLRDYSAYADALRFRIIHAHDTYKAWGADRLLQLKQDVIRAKPLAQMTRLLDDLLEPAVDEMYAVARRLAETSDAVLGYFIAHPVQLAALKSGRPYVPLVWSPDFYPSRHTPPSVFPDLGRWINPWSWKLVAKISNPIVLPCVNRLRAREGYPLARDLFSEVWESRPLTLIAASPSLYPRPADWPGHLQICGHLGLPEPAQPWAMPDELRRFLDAGEPPVYMTFGSMPASLPATELFVEAARAARCRAIIQTADPVTSSDPSIHHLQSAPHHELFPRCALVVHHGGAGTTHAASLAGCPSLIVEHLGDQIFWGAQLKRAGLTTRTLHRRSVTPKTLAAEIRRILQSPALKTRARAIAASMQQEDGVQRAVALLESRLGDA